MLITKQQFQKKIQFRVRLNENVIKEIDAYCAWAELNNRDYFIEEACKYIFSHSPEWMEYKKNNNI